MTISYADLQTDLGESLDGPTFEQILEMDDEEDDEGFSHSIVYGFFDQAETTFGQIEDALESKDLEKLSSLGHFLKGSSATLGLTLVKQSCEKIQHWGKETDETGGKPITADEALKNIESEMVKLRREYERCETKLKEFYGDP